MLLLGATLFAQDGAAIYQQKCVACHAMKSMMDADQKSEMMKKMQNATPEEKEAMKAKMMKKMKESKMLAPAMPMVSMRLKKMTKDRAEFITFVKDYIQNPAQKKGYCMPMAYKRFGTMPPIGKSMSDAEREAVAVWLHDNFKETWSGSMEGKSCDSRNKGMKKEKSMKCGGGKCGAASKEKSMKCGAGKCGGSK